MQINVVTVPLAYFDDDLQFYFKDQSNQHQRIGTFFNFKTENQTTMIHQLEQSLNLKIQPNQIQYLPYFNANQQLILIELIFIPPLDILESDLNHWVALSERQILKPIDQSIIQAIQTHLTHQYQIYKLKAFPFLIEKRFTTYSITAMLNQILNIRIKPNNLKRDLKDQVKIIDYDRTHRGRPKAIFELK